MGGHPGVLAKLGVQVGRAETEPLCQILDSQRIGVMTVEVTDHLGNEGRDRPVLLPSPEFLEPEPKLAPDEVPQYPVVHIGVVEGKQRLLGELQRGIGIDPLEHARPGEALRQPVQPEARGHAGVISPAR
jgi:hypothetical protein